MDENKDLLKEFISGGWIVALVGAGSMIARLLTDDMKFTLKEQFKRIVAASICSVIAWFLLENIQMSSMIKAIVYGSIGVISPELIAGLMKAAKKFSKNPFGAIKALIK